MYKEIVELDDQVAKMQAAGVNAQNVRDGAGKVYDEKVGNLKKTIKAVDAAIVPPHPGAGIAIRRHMRV